MKKRWILLFILVLGAAGFFYWRGNGQKASASPGPSPERAVPVILGNAERRDVPVWLTGIGTVQASNTVTVRPRVSGSLDRVEFTEGASVKEGDVLAQIDPRPYESALAQAQAKKTQDEAQLANARLEADRFRNLLQDAAVSRQQFDQAEASVAQLSALVQADDAAIKAAELDLDFTTIRAPISGRTGVRMVDAGNLVTANQGEGLVVITQIQPVAVIFTLPQQHLSKLSQATHGNQQRLKVEALADDGTTLDTGELELVDNQIDTSTGTLRLKAVFKNESMALWPGQFVTARVLVETLTGATVVAREAVQPGLDGNFCYVVKPDQTVEARIVTMGLQLDAHVVIENGLEGGERIVVSGQSKLRPGMKVISQEKAS